MGPSAQGSDGTPRRRKRRWLILGLFSAVVAFHPQLMTGMVERELRLRWEAEIGSPLEVEGFRFGWRSIRIERIRGRYGDLPFVLEGIRYRRFFDMERSWGVRRASARVRRFELQLPSGGPVVLPSPRRLVGDGELRIDLEVEQCSILSGEDEVLPSGPGRVVLRLWQVNSLRLEMEALDALLQHSAGRQSLMAELKPTAATRSWFPTTQGTTESAPWKLDLNATAPTGQLWPPDQLGFSGPVLPLPWFRVEDVSALISRRELVASATLNGGAFLLQGKRSQKGAWKLKAAAEKVPLSPAANPVLARLIPLLSGAGGRLSSDLALDFDFEVDEVYDLESWRAARGEGKVSLVGGTLSGGPILEAAARVVRVSSILQFLPFETRFRVEKGQVSLVEPLRIRASLLVLEIDGRTLADGKLEHSLRLGVETPELLRRWFPRLDATGALSLELRGTLERPRLELPKGVPETRLDAALRRLLRRSE